MSGAVGPDKHRATLAERHCQGEPWALLHPLSNSLQITLTISLAVLSVQVCDCVFSLPHLYCLHRLSKSTIPGSAEACSKLPVQHSLSFWCRALRGLRDPGAPMAGAALCLPPSTFCLWPRASFLLRAVSPIHLSCVRRAPASCPGCCMDLALPSALVLLHTRLSGGTLLHPLAVSGAVGRLCPTPGSASPADTLGLWQLTRPALESSQLLGHHSLLMLLPGPVGLF